MKKLLSIFICALFFFTIFLPLGALIACAFGYSFIVFSYSFFAVVIAAEAATALILSFFCEAEQIKRVYTAFVAFLPILIIVNCGVSFLKCSPNEFAVIEIAMMLAFLFAVILSLKIGRPATLNAVILAVSLVAVIPFVIINLLIFVFAGFGQSTVVEMIPSPDDERWVEVVDNDQGALGGATVVRVCEDKGIDAVVFKVQKNPKRIYVGEWREYLELDIRWKDDDCVIINSKEYVVD